MRPKNRRETERSASQRGRVAAFLVTAATSVIAIAAVAWIYLSLRPEPEERETPATEEGDGAKLREGSDYRVLVVVARVRPTNEDGGEWDSGRSSTAAPDPFYEIWWRGNRVYESQEVEDVLVASWSNMALPELYKLVSDEKVSLETLKEGALITARTGDTIEIRLYDDDPLKNDLIEEVTIPVSELRVGDSDLVGRRGLESMTLRVIPRDTQQLRNLIR